MFRSAVALHPGAFSSAEIAALRSAALASPLIGRSTLSGTFQSSRGFAVTFRDGGLVRVLDRFPFLAPFLARARERASYRSVLRFGERLLAAHAPNAFFLNLLLLSEGAAVERHVDATLRKPSGDAEAVPRVVSVLYLQVPPASGGELVLHQGGREVGRVRPSEGTLLHFSGNLAHEVLPFSGAPDSRRASLVLEQYYLAPEFLAALPEFHLQSRAGFSAYLADHSRRPMAGASFELDG